MAKSEIRWVLLGDYIQARNERNTDLQWDKECIEGVNSKGTFQPTKANTDDIDMKPYKAVYHGDFVYNPSRLNIGSFAYREAGFCIVSHLYVVFFIKEEKKTELLPEYLWIFCKRDEFLRMVDYHNFGSQRAEFNIHDISKFRVPIPYTNGKPDITRQQQIVDAWQGLRRMKEENEQLSEPLFQLCRSYLENLKKEYTPVAIGKYIEPVDERNTELKYLEDSVVGLSTTKEIIPTKANLKGVDLSGYKILHPNEIAFVSDTSRRGDKMSLAINKTNSTLLVSSISQVFKTKEKDLLPMFLYLWFKRPEFDRYARFHSWGSAREAFSYEDMERVKMLLPPIEVQRAIVNIYHCAEEAKRIAIEADKLSREICPALMQHIIHESE